VRDEELNEELRTHLEMDVEQRMARGESRGDAEAAARREFGNLTHVAEVTREMWGGQWLEQLSRDVRYALRSLKHSPMFTTVVVIALALGIGANTAIFSVVRGVLLKPLPHRGSDRLVYLRQSANGAGQSDMTFSVPEVRDLRAGVPSFAGIAEFSAMSAVHGTSDGPVRIRVGLVTGNYFDVMGLSPVVGRLTQPSDDGAAAPPVAVLGYDYWKTRFGGDSAVLGKKILLNERPVTVIGVLQPAPFFPERVDALLNLVNSAHHLSATMQQSRTHRMTSVVARVKTASTVDKARAEVATVYSALQRAYPEAYPASARYQVAVLPLKDILGERARLTLWLLMACAAFVLIVSAANVTNLTLMRGIRREHELVVRTALGAARSRLRRLLLVENLLLATLGGALGMVIAIAGVRLLTVFAARYSPRANEIRLDGTVFAFTLAVSLGLALTLSFLASLPREADVGSRVLAGPQRVSGSRRRQRLQRGLVVLQVAVSVVLLAGAGLLTRTMIRLSTMDTGLTTEDMLTMRVTLLMGGSGAMQDSATLVAAGVRLDQIRAALAVLPGVARVGVGASAPLRPFGYFSLVQREGPPPRPGEAMARADFRTANVDYFAAAGIPVLRGRAFDQADESRDNVIINKTFADQFFPSEDPVGKRIAFKADWRPDSLHYRTVIGVVGDTHDVAPNAAPGLVVFMPMAGMPSTSAVLVVRADRHVAGLAPTATRVVREHAPNALIEDVMTLAEYKAKSVSPQRLNAELISTFGILAVVIAAVGIAGVLAFSVSARTNEIGIRMSLGADSARVQRMILREGGALVATGLVLGSAGAYATTGVMRQLLFGVEPHDPATFVAGTVAMATVGIVACWIPARRAARIDPMTAIRG